MNQPQHARPPCPSPTLRFYPDPCPLSRWCISSSVVPFSSCPQSFPASGSFPMNESALRMRWPEYWSFSFSISPSNEHTGLISFRMHWLDLLAVQGALKSLFQHYCSKASILLHSAFFIVQLSHPYMTTGKTIALTGWTFVGKVMSLLFNMLSRLVIAFLLRSKRLLISPLQSPFAVILEPPWCTPFPIWNQPVPCPVLIFASWPTYRFLKRLVRWSGIPTSLRISTVCCGPHSQRLWHSQ